MKGRLSLVVQCIHISFRTVQLRTDSLVRRKKQRCLPVQVSGVNIGTPLKQLIYDLGDAVEDGHVQGRDTLRVGHVWICAHPQQ